MRLRAAQRDGSNRYGKANVLVYVFQPANEPESWSHARLWDNAQSIPGVKVQADRDGSLANQFGARTSGQVFLYDRAGKLLFDGGITSGQDLLKSLAHGARGALIGKAFLYGLGAMGEAGVTKAIEIIRKELDVSMALTGQRDVQSVSPGILERIERHGRPGHSC